MSSEQKTDAATAPRPGFFGWNLVLLIGLGTLFSFWVALYTDYLDDFIKLLALGGILSWLAFVGKILTESRLKALQQAVDDRILNRRWLVFALVIAIGAFCFWAAMRATIQVTGSRGIGLTQVKVAENNATIYEKEIGAGERVRFNTSVLKRRTFNVVVRGYPPAEVHLGSLNRPELTVPDSFRRPVVILRPSVELLRQRSQGLKVNVKVNGLAYSSAVFDGHPFWLGTDADTTVPERLFNSWKMELDAVKAPELMSILRVPASLGATPLGVGDQVCVELLGEQDAVYVRQDFKIKPIEKAEDYPQEVKVDDRKTDFTTPDPHC